MATLRMRNQRMRSESMYRAVTGLMVLSPEALSLLLKNKTTMKRIWINTGTTDMSSGIPQLPGAVGYLWVELLENLCSYVHLRFTPLPMAGSYHC